MKERLWLCYGVWTSSNSQKQSWAAVGKLFKQNRLDSANKFLSKNLKGHMCILSVCTLQQTFRPFFVRCRTAPAVERILATLQQILAQKGCTSTSCSGLWVFLKAGFSQNLITNYIPLLALWFFCCCVFSFYTSSSVCNLGGGLLRSWKAKDIPAS